MRDWIVNTRLVEAVLQVEYDPSLDKMFGQIQIQAFGPFSWVGLKENILDVGTFKCSGQLVGLHGTLSHYHKVKVT